MARAILTPTYPIAGDGYIGNGFYALAQPASQGDACWLLRVKYYAGTTRHAERQDIAVWAGPGTRRYTTIARTSLVGRSITLLPAALQAQPAVLWGALAILATVPGQEAMARLYPVLTGRCQGCNAPLRRKDRAPRAHRYCASCFSQRGGGLEEWPA